MHYLTKVRCNVKGEGIVFGSPQEVISAYQLGQVHIHARIKVRIPHAGIVETTVGRVLLFAELPEGSEFAWINKILAKSDLGKLVERVYHRFGGAATVKFLDGIKKLGFHTATRAGVSFSIDNLVVPEKKILLLSGLKKKFKKLISSILMVLSLMVNVTTKLLAFGCGNI